MNSEYKIQRNAEIQITQKLTKLPSWNEAHLQRYDLQYTEHLYPELLLVV